MNCDSEMHVTSELTDRECPGALHIFNLTRKAPSPEGAGVMDRGDIKENERPIRISIAFAFMIIYFYDIFLSDVNLKL
ncbi:MAG: hypothetical protein AB1632_00830 [Nitrospirota bacterium]